jgi:glucose-6-phosphate isomerase
MSGAGIEVSADGAAAEAVDQHVSDLVAASFASKLFDQDPTLWGDDAESEAKIRLSWVGLASSSRHLVDEVSSIREELEADGIDRVVLCGMGGSSLAPEVICATSGKPLVVLDSSHPDQVRSALESLERTVVVVSSKSGSTLETDSQKRAFEDAFAKADIDASRRIVVVTDPGSPLDESARSDGYRVVNADPEVGGRYSALTAFGLVPSGLAGVDIGALLDEASAVADVLSSDDESNPGLRLGAALGGTSPLRDKIVLVDEGSGISGFPAWAEQLLAESTGKDGTGLLPVVVAGSDSPEVQEPPSDATVVRLVSDTGTGVSSSTAGEGSTIRVSGVLGAQMLLWEVATAVAGRLLGINPFDQPDVESAKKAARELIDAPPKDTEPDFTDGPVSARASGDDWLGDARTLPDAVARLLRQVDTERGYLAVMAYLDRLDNADLEGVRESLARHLGRPVTFGWGPRFLHSTGQFHKGGPRVGVYLQITDEPVEDLPIPGRDFGFAALIAAQAAGDAQVLAEHDRPVLSIHLEDRDAGLAAVREVLS